MANLGRNMLRRKWAATSRPTANMKMLGNAHCTHRFASFFIMCRPTEEDNWNLYVSFLVFTSVDRPLDEFQNSRCKKKILFFSRSQHQQSDEFIERKKKKEKRFKVTNRIEYLQQFYRIMSSTLLHLHGESHSKLGSMEAALWYMVFRIWWMVVCCTHTKNNKMCITISAICAMCIVHMLITYVYCS